MLQTEHYLYVAFMCQQAIEKILKACYVRRLASTPLYTHNLLRLIKELTFKGKMGDEMMGAVEELNSYYYRVSVHRGYRRVDKATHRGKSDKYIGINRGNFQWIKARL
jgi:HEPN domain-containing protein